MVSGVLHQVERAEYGRKLSESWVEAEAMLALNPLHPEDRHRKTLAAAAEQPRSRSVQMGHRPPQRIRERSTTKQTKDTKK